MSRRQPPFQDRHEAGRRLAAALAHLRPEHPLVIALPRGGVPVAFEIARALDADLDLLFVRKIGAPGHAELGLGAVIDGAEPQLVLNDALMREIAPPASYVEAEMHRQLAEIERRRAAYLGKTPPLDPRGRTVILVDDGIATGGTIRAALRGVRRTGAARVVLAVPVAPRDCLAELAGACDELVCLESPTPFVAVGIHYADFRQTSDEEVVGLLSRSRKSQL